MLELRNIKKVYEVGDEKVTALNDVSLTLRDSEFVSVLGPSGCGKTTLLNIIGGLDHYDSGDLLINSVPQKDTKTEIGTVTEIILWALFFKAIILSLTKTCFQTWSWPLL